jgi:ribonuclease HI
MFKTLERLVLWHLECTTFRLKPFNTNQHAFRKGHSTEAALSKTVNQLEQAVHRDMVAVSLFLDIEGAFDNLETNSAIKAMERHGLPKKITNWYGKYLKGRSSVVQYGDQTHQRILTRGTPQGGVLSPILWNIAFDGLLDMFHKGRANIRGFADDACITVTARKASTAIPYLQAAIRKAVRWGNNHGLKFSPKKTLAMVFSRQKEYAPPTTHLMLGNHQVPYVETVKYLGIHLDRRLNWNTHITKKVANAKRLLFKMRNSLGITWGPKPHLLRWIFTGIVRPALTYGSLVWGHVIKYKHQLDKLKRLHGLITRMFAPKRKSTPIAGMEMIFHLPPLDLFIKGEAIKSFFRNRHLLDKNWSGKSTKQRKPVGHILALERLIEEFQLPDLVWDSGPAEFNFEPRYEVQADSYKEGKDLIPPPRDTKVCYTDGSKFQKKVGAGFIMYTCNKQGQFYETYNASFHLNDYNTVFQGEICAIHQAAIYLLEENKVEPLPKEVYILSDSRSSLMALDRHINTSRLVNQCKASLELLATHTKVKLRWIKAHKGYIGNEKADELAKAGALNREGDNAILLDEVPAPYSLLRQLVEQGVNKRWAARWQAAKHADGKPIYRQTKHFFPKPDKNKAYFLIKQDRATLGKLIQFITGHAFLKRHESLIQNKKGESEDDPEYITPTCQLCDRGDETPYHLIHDCGPLLHKSFGLFGLRVNEFQKVNYQLEWSAAALLRFIKLPQVEELFRIGSPASEGANPNKMAPDEGVEAQEQPPHMLIATSTGV